MSESKHILVVEDEEHLAIGIQYNLEKEDYQVTVAGDGPSALRAVEENADEIDLVILDIMLPGMSGYDVCESLRDQGCDMPILILSARTLAEDRTQGFDVGADQYLTKPFDLDELLSRVKNLLALYDRRSQGKPMSNSTLKHFEFGNAKIDFETFEVVVSDSHIRLTPMELNLLRYFIENQGRVIPRQELLEEVWNMPGTISTRAPDQFIRRLRKIFEPDPAKPKYLLTIRDGGYRFVSDPDGKKDQ